MHACIYTLVVQCTSKTGDYQILEGVENAFCKGLARASIETAAPIVNIGNIRNIRNFRGSGKGRRSHCRDGATGREEP